MVYTATDIVIDNPPDSAGGNYEMVSGGKMCNGVKCLKTINICWLLSMKESLVFKYRIFLTRSLNEFHLSVQVLITKGSQGLFVFCFVFFLLVHQCVLLSGCFLCTTNLLKGKPHLSHRGVGEESINHELHFTHV